MPLADVGRLLLLSTLWGGSFIFLRISSPYIGPIGLVAARVTIAAICLVIYTRAIGVDIQWRKYWRKYFIIGLLNSAIPFALFAYAALTLPASFSAIMNAITPVFAAIIGAIWLKDRLTLANMIGIVLGITGVVVLVGFAPLKIDQNFGLAVGACLLATLSFGVVGNYTKARLKGAPPLGMAAGGLIWASLAMLPLVPFFPIIKTPDLTVILMVLALGLFATGFAYVLFYQLIVNVGAINALTVTFLVPLFGMFWSAIFLSETITLSKIVGCLITLAGTMLVTGFRPDKLLRQKTSKTVEARP